MTVEQFQTIQKNLNDINRELDKVQDLIAKINKLQKYLDELSMNTVNKINHQLIFDDQSYCDNCIDYIAIKNILIDNISKELNKKKQELANFQLNEKILTDFYDNPFAILTRAKEKNHE